MSDQPQYDVFLAHNSQDKPQVRAIAKELRQRGLIPWLDEDVIPPGRWFQDVIQQAIPNVKSAAILIGSGGLGKWQTLELRAFISQCVEADIPVIPILLPGVDEFPEYLPFLKQLNCVFFHNRMDDVEALDKLEWGITGRKPKTETKLIDNLISSRGVDYMRLRDLLVAQMWKKADRETVVVMLKVFGREKEGWLRIEDLRNFPCQDLRTIDTLWVKYSKGHFGFSVQKRIWLEVGGKADHETECLLGDRIGWRVKGNWLDYHGLTFSLNAPQGHLPGGYKLDDVIGFEEWFRGGPLCWLLCEGSSVALRLVNCKIQ